MPDERSSPSGGWREVYREMGVDPGAERDDPVDAAALPAEERSTATGDATEADPDRDESDPDSEERRDASAADD